MKKTMLLLPALLVLAMASLIAQPAALPSGFQANQSDGQEALADNGTDSGVNPSRLRTGRPEGLTAPVFTNLDEYIVAHLVYPEAARENGLEGQVRLRLAIGPDGRVEDAQVVDGLGLGCDDAARTLALNMPAWTPATQSGIPVRSRATIALNFRIR